MVSVPTFRFLAAVLALMTALGGWGGAFGLGMATVVVTLLALLCGAWFGGGIGLDRALDVGSLLVRSAVPIGLAGGRARLRLRWPSRGAFVVMFVLILRVETADFLVGTGSSNAVEGPVAGLVAVAVAGFALRLIPPELLTQDSLTAFAALTGLCCVVGQLVASAVLPRGVLPPGFRRLDSAWSPPRCGWCCSHCLPRPRRLLNSAVEAQSVEALQTQGRRFRHSL